MDPINVGLPTLERINDNSSSSGNSSSDDSLDSEASQLDDDCFLIAILALHLYVTVLSNFQPIELSKENQVLVNPTFPVNDLL